MPGEADQQQLAEELENMEPLRSEIGNSSSQNANSTTANNSANKEAIQQQHPSAVVKWRLQKRQANDRNGQQAEDEEQSKRARERKHVLKKKNNERVSRIHHDAKSFEDLCQKSTLIVDRTDFIKAIMMRPYEPNILITLPSGVGKTMNLSMAKLFLECLNDNRKQKIRDDIFHQHFELEKQFTIMGDEQFLKDHYGQYPVLFINCAGIKGASKKIEYRFGEEIVKLFRENNFLLDMLDEKKKSSSSEKIATQRVLEIEFGQFDEFLQEIGRIKWNAAVNLLCKLLYQKWGRKVVVIIDEYDAPILNSVNPLADWDAITEMIDEFVSSFRNCENVERMIIGGQYFFSIDGMSIIRYGMEQETTGHTLTRHFGFTQDEFAELNISYGGHINLLKAKEYCNGIRISSNLPLFGTRTSLSLLRLEEHWEEAINQSAAIPTFVSHFTRIFQNPAVAAAIKQLLSKDGTFQLEKDYRSAFGKTNMHKLLLHAYEKTPPIEDDAVVQVFLQFLLASGFLVKNNQHQLSVPNDELHGILKQYLLNDYYKAQYGIDPQLIGALINVLQKMVNSDKLVENMSMAKEIKEEFESLLNAPKGKIHRNEHHIHMMLEFAALMMSDLREFAGDFAKKSNTPNKEKRPDIIACFDRVAICVELKWDDNTKKTTPKYALGQIGKRKYLTDPKITKNANLERVYAIGIMAEEKKNTGTAKETYVTVGCLVESGKRKGNEKASKMLERVTKELVRKYPI